MFDMYDTTADKILVIAVHIFLLMLIVAMVYPFWDQVVLSFCTAQQASTQTIRLWPTPISLEGYVQVFKSPWLFSAFANSIIRVVMGTAWTVFITALTAYPLSREDCPFKGLITAYILFTMMFSGGMIPGYLLRRDLNLLDKRLVLILPGLGAWNIIIMRNFFQSIPTEIQESARLDGASEFGTFRRIILPLSKPVLATIALWSAVGHWNAFFDVLIYIRDMDKFTLPVILRRVLLEGQLMQMGMEQYDTQMPFYKKPTAETTKAALLMVSTVPILVVYPFVQRYFIKGIMLGAVKG